MAQADYPKVRCYICREAFYQEGVEAQCVKGRCQTGFDLLPDKALRLIEIRGLLLSLNDLHLADQVCAEYQVDLDDLRMLAEMENILRQLQPTQEGTGNGGSKTDSSR